MVLLFLMKAEMIAERDGKAIRTIDCSFPFPSVIKLASFVRIPYKKVDLSRKNILRRDNNQCQYCGTKQGVLTIDHIIPRSRGGGETWENLVTACVKCNNRKGNHTPEEARMKMLKLPKRPNHILFIQQHAGALDDKWRPFLFLD